MKVTFEQCRSLGVSDPRGLLKRFSATLHNPAQDNALKYTRDLRIIDCKVNIIGIGDDSICVIVSSGIHTYPLKRHHLFSPMEQMSFKLELFVLF